MDATTASRLIELNLQFYQTFAQGFLRNTRAAPAGRAADAGGFGRYGVYPRRGLRQRGIGAGTGTGGGIVDPIWAWTSACRCCRRRSPAWRIFPPVSSKPISPPPSWDASLSASSHDVVYAFAVLHHIPGEEIRLRLLRKIDRLLKPGGRFIPSNWQFLNSDRLKARIQDWKKAGLSPSRVDEGDYLLDWRAGGSGLRYVHHFSEVELDELAARTGFRVVELFLFRRAKPQIRALSGLGKKFRCLIFSPLVATI